VSPADRGRPRRRRGRFASPGDRRGDRTREPYDWDVYNHPPPIPVPDGIRAKSRRGDIGSTWWSRRFVAALESYYGTSASRLARGRSYARAGQVVRMVLEPGRVEAIVQGSRAEPYAVTITVRVLDDADWARVEVAMAARAVFLARLLVGEMPDEIEEAFEAADVRLFPARRGDLVTACTCPDTANPCKHSAAVYYLLAESFDADPFRIFAWRGRPREQLVADLRALRPASSRGAGASLTAADAGVSPAGPAADDGRSEPDTLERFWHGSGAWREVAIDPHPTSPPDGILRDIEADVADLLGPDAIAVLRSAYDAAAQAARRRLDPAAGVHARVGRRSGRRR
jgi:uncharacterized Zn finger protein